MAFGQLHLDDGTDTLDIYFEHGEVSLKLNQLSANELYVRDADILRTNKQYSSDITINLRHATKTTRDTILKMKGRDDALSVWYQDGDEDTDKIYWDNSTTTVATNRVQRKMRFALGGVAVKHSTWLGKFELSFDLIEQR